MRPCLRAYPSVCRVSYDEDYAIALAKEQAVLMTSYPVTHRRAFLECLGVTIAAEADIKASVEAEKEKKLRMRIAKICKETRREWDHLKV